MTEKAKKRIHSIDTFKCFAIFGVIWIHAEPLSLILTTAATHSGVQIFSHLFLMLCRLAVPFFFTVSGYFLYSYLTNDRPMKTYLGRLFRVFAFWSVFYLLLPTYHYFDVQEFGLLRAVYWSWTHAFREFILDPLRLITQGGKYHLWFLSSLMAGAVGLYFCHKFRLIAVGVVLGLLLYAFDLSQRSYSMFFEYSTRFEFSHAPFVSLIFLMIGYRIARQSEPGRGAWGLTFGGLSLMLLEKTFLVHQSGIEGLRFSFLIGNIPCAAGLLKLALRYPCLGQNSGWSEYGKLTLGIYVIHLGIMEILLVARDFLPSHGWIILLPALTWGMSVFMIKRMSKSPKLRRFVS